MFNHLSGAVQMSIIGKASERQMDAALAILRVVVGTVFVVHGAQKLFVYGLAGVTGAFEGMGVPLAGLVGPGVALLEFAGGIALIVGLLTRLAASGLAATMLGAMVLVHLPAGFFVPNGVEFVLTLFATSVVLALTGAGAWSLDARLAGREAPEGSAPFAVATSGSRRAA
jgi:putative oxidoreductase